MNSHKNSGGDYDTDVSHYSVSELLDLVGLSGIEGIDENDFSDIIQGFVDKYREVDIALSRFFSDVGHRLYSLLVVGGEDGGGGGGGRGVEWGVKDDDDKKEGLAMSSNTNARQIIMSDFAIAETVLDIRASIPAGNIAWRVCDRMDTRY
jgi:hypothetical protein